MTSAATEAEDAPRRRGAKWARVALKSARIVLGFLAAILAPAIVFALLLLIFGVPDAFMGVDAVGFIFKAKQGFHFVYALSAVTVVVTVPAAFVLGLPAVGLFLALGWRDWLRHAAAGAVIGGIAGYAVLSSALIKANQADLLGFSAVFAAFGVLSTTFYWVTVHAPNRILRLTVGLGSLFFAIFLLLNFLSIRAEMLARAGA